MIKETPNMILLFRVGGRIRFMLVEPKKPEPPPTVDAEIPKSRILQPQTHHKQSRQHQSFPGEWGKLCILWRKVYDNAG
jgi:hypothetical protein